LIPLSGYITKPEIWDAAFGSPETGMIHTNTYGNNTLACAVGLRTLQYVIENDLPRQSKEKGEYVIEKLKAIASKYPLLIKEVRGRGLFIGIEFKKQAELLKMAEGAVEIMAFTLCKKLFEIGKCFVAFTFSNPTTIRVEPPLNTTYEQLDIFINVFEKAIFAALKELGIKEEDVMKAESK
jgi:putrescine aminotransferase